MREVLNKILIEYNRFYLSDNQIDKIFSSEYNRQAIDFLNKTETKIDITSIGPAYPSWQNKTRVNKYRVTLKNKKHTYEFDFYDSIKNTEDRKTLKYDFYSVLAGLGHVVPDSFDDFCYEYGYEFKDESEYIKTKTIHLACIDQNKNLKKLFTEDQLNLLSDIN